MRSNWHHGHSMGAGLMFGLVLASYRVWLVIAFAFVVGCLLTLAVMSGQRLVGWVGRRWT